MNLTAVQKTLMVCILSIASTALTSFLVLQVPAVKEPGVRKIVIDPGHGGKDPGCLGRTAVEKDIALSISLSLGRLITEQFPDVEVIYTRDKDVFIPLHERAQIANKADADLFISIHCNTIARRNMAQGSETYVMGLHRAEENLDVAKRENAAILMEDNYIAHYDGYDPDSPEGHIILSMYQNAYLDQSIFFADLIEKQFVNGLARKSRGVKQAGFLVLRTTTMPSVLIEAGFLSHDQDEAYLGNARNHADIAQAILRAFAEYKAYMEGNIPEDGLVLTPEVNSSNELPDQEDPSAEVLEVSTDKKPAPAVPAQETRTTTPELLKTEKPGSGKVTFYVQVAASKSLLEEGAMPWGKNTPIEMRKEDGYYKYLAGPFSTPDEAGNMLKSLRTGCCKDAFTVAYRDTKRIPVNEAVASLHQ